MKRSPIILRRRHHGITWIQKCIQIIRSSGYLYIYIFFFILEIFLRVEKISKKKISRCPVGELSGRGIVRSGNRPGSEICTVTNQNKINHANIAKNQTQKNMFATLKICRKKLFLISLRRAIEYLRRNLS